MAQGKRVTATVIVNNKPATTDTKDAELVVVNGVLVHDHQVTNPGVNTKDMFK